MVKAVTKISRRQQILTALATMLAESPGERITTAAIATSVGVSEAALYRHFPSKTKMFEGLIEYLEETVFAQITKINEQEKFSLNRCEKIISFLLGFAEQNPGIARLLVGDALMGETERLRQRIALFFERIDAQLKQALREAELRDGLHALLSAGAITHLLMVYLDGCITQFVRSEFQRLPSAHWPEQWQAIAAGILQSAVVE